MHRTLVRQAEILRMRGKWLRPGGRMAICAWLAGPHLATDEQRQLVYDVCEGFFCPSLGTAENYQRWMQDAGLVVERSEIWTEA